MISFGEDQLSLDDLGLVLWEDGEKKQVAFFKNEFVPIEVISVENINLESKLNEILDGNPMSIDFEWKPDPDIEHLNPIGLFQFCSSKGILIVTNLSYEPSPVLENFITTHQFFGKGMGYDQKKLLNMFGHVFVFEDIETTRLHPNGITCSFVGLVEEFIGEPAAQFKDKHISMSDWSQRPLTVKQVLYASFDVYAMYLCRQKIIEIFGGSDFIETNVSIKTHAGKKGKSNKTKISTKTIPIRQLTIHPQFPLDVDFIDSTKIQEAIRNIDIEGHGFVPRRVYSPKVSLYIYLYVSNQVNGNYCEICKNSYDDILNHCWMNHFDRLLEVYYPDQVPQYLLDIQQQVQYANDMAIIQDNKIICSVCEKQFPSYHCFYTHCRMMHASKAHSAESYDLRQLWFIRMSRFGEIDGNICKKCNRTFDSEIEIKDHSWRDHGEEIGDLFKHKPANYPPELYKEAREIGITCMTKISYGIDFWGTIACGFCRIGFDDPGELFIHMFHRHTRIRVVSVADFNIWPLPYKSLPIMIQNALFPIVIDSAIKTLYDSNIFTGDELKECKECGIKFGSLKQMHQHIIDNHLIIQFEPYLIAKKNEILDDE